eukprot:SAG11_NODE_621_length_8169_cov_2.866914_8_plen_123_part_00
MILNIIIIALLEANNIVTLESRGSQLAHNTGGGGIKQAVASIGISKKVLVTKKDSLGINKKELHATRQAVAHFKCGTVDKARASRATFRASDPLGMKRGAKRAHLIKSRRSSPSCRRATLRI